MGVGLAIFKRELKSYFSTPVAYVMLLAFLLSASFLVIKARFFEARQADLRAFFDVLPSLFIVFVPAVGMKLWAEERKTGTFELLFTLPVTVPEAVLGKFLAAWFFLLITLAMTSPLVLTILYLGEPDKAVILTGYAGALLLAGSYLAISIFCSALTRSQIVSFVSSTLLCSVFVYADAPAFLGALQGTVPVFLSDAVAHMGFIGHFESIRRGVLEFRDLSFYLIVMAGWLTAACVMLGARRGV